MKHQTVLGRDSALRGPRRRAKRQAAEPNRVRRTIHPFRFTRCRMAGTAFIQAFSGAVSCLLIFLGMFALTANVRAQATYEHILHYDSRVVVQTNGALSVTETIDVQAEGDKIKHGIYRDFPQLYHGPLGLRIKTGFTVQSVTRDGQPEAYHLADRANGVRVYIGQEETLVSRGEHTYQLVYTTDRQLGFFAGHDELYWNVTGNGWAFSIDDVTATVLLPAGAAVQKVTAYTGAQGDKGQDFTATNFDNQAVFKTTRRLPAENGLTVVVEWPKGFVIPPTFAAGWRDFYRNNPGMICLLGGWLLTLAYFIGVKLSVAKSPPPGVIIPRYAPPADFSPAAVRFLARMGFDNRTFAAAVLNLAVQGAFKICEGRRGVFHKKIYSLVPPRSAARLELSVGEDLVRRELVGDGRVLVLEQANYATLQAAQQKLKTHFASQMKGTLFNTNLRFWFPGPLLMAAVLVLAVQATADIKGAGVALIISALGTLLVLGVLQARYLFLTIFTCLFVGIFGAVVIFDPSVSLPGWMFLLPALLTATNYIFFNRMKTPTPEGRKILDEIEGFKMYLSVAERDQLNLKGAPERTPQLFEQFLPYAFALGVEKIWQQKFAGVLAAAGTNPGETAYSPAWYYGDSWQDNLASGTFAGALGDSLAGAISSASTAPGSGDGGGGGGGCSGGGGGGGGGGGW